MKGEAKQAIRERVWSRLEAAGAVAPGVAGYIPDFEGAGLAAQRLASLPIWSRAKVLKVVPDRPQQPVRQRALEEGKLVYMAAPGWLPRTRFTYSTPPRSPSHRLKLRYEK